MSTSTTGHGEPVAIGAHDGDLVAGTDVGGYRIERVLGSGGFGTVYGAVQPVIGKQVAVKVLARKYSADPAIVSRFVAEARAVNQIRHRNIIDIFSFGQLADGRHYYIAEHLEGKPLDVHLRERGPLTVAEALPLLHAIARALDAAHAKGIAHRDLKPENIFLVRDTDGTTYPKLLDFGIAKLMAPDGDVRHKTNTGVVLGTPYYMSPEQCRGKDVDHRTDIYSFGIVVYRMLTGTYPFDGDDYMELLFKQINDEAPPPSTRNAALTPAVDDAIAWMMRKDRMQRPATVIEAVNALDPSSSVSSPLLVASRAQEPAPAPESGTADNSLSAAALAATLTSQKAGDADAHTSTSEAGGHSSTRDATTRHRGGPAARERALATLAEMIARGNAAQFLLAPVEPGEAAFPEPWAPSKVGVQLLLRRLAWHAGLSLEIEIDDRRVGAPPTERKPATAVELLEVRDGKAWFVVGFIGADDVVGTLAHEIGTLYAVLHRPDGSDPYRTAAEAPVITVDPDGDHERGAIAAVFVGLGVLAANAAHQQYVSPGPVNGGYVPHEYDVIQAGAVAMSTLTYLVAVQAIVRGEREPPRGLGQSQRDEVLGYMKTLAGQRASLCERLGIATDLQPGTRETPVPFTTDPTSVIEEVPRKNAFRWRTHRGGVGFLAGTVLGIGLAFVAWPEMMPLAALGAASAGHLFGRRVRTPRCSACATVVRADATVCRSCGAALRGDIESLADRLEAEERLELETGSDRDSDQPSPT